MHITSVTNPKIKEITRLRKAAERKKEDLIVIEGRKEAEAARAAGMSAESFFFCPELNSGPETPRSGEQKNFFTVTRTIFKKISQREHPDGWLMLAKPRYLQLEDIRLGQVPLVVILESTEKPGNLGAVIRTAAAAGADAVIISDSQTDIYGPNVIRASRGAVFSEQIAVSATARVIIWLKTHKIKIYAAAPLAGMFHTEPDYTGPSAIVIGAEHEGLSEQWLKVADKKISIPMAGGIDSLNASVSAAIVIYEAVRQRNLQKNPLRTGFL
jgi:RNA methyltransferase, TrmH family